MQPGASGVLLQSAEVPVPTTEPVLDPEEVDELPVEPVEPVEPFPVPVVELVLVAVDETDLVTTAPEGASACQPSRPWPFTSLAVLSPEYV